MQTACEIVPSNALITLRIDQLVRYARTPSDFESIIVLISWIADPIQQRPCIGVLYTYFDLTVKYVESIRTAGQDPELTVIAMQVLIERSNILEAAIKAIEQIINN